MAIDREQIIRDKTLAQWEAYEPHRGIWRLGKAKAVVRLLPGSGRRRYNYHKIGDKFIPCRSDCEVCLAVKQLMSEDRDADAQTLKVLERIPLALLLRPTDVPRVWLIGNKTAKRIDEIAARTELADPDKGHDLLITRSESGIEIEPAREPSPLAPDPDQRLKLQYTASSLTDPRQPPPKDVLRFRLRDEFFPGEEIGE